MITRGTTILGNLHIDTIPNLTLWWYCEPSSRWDPLSTKFPISFGIYILLGETFKTWGPLYNCCWIYIYYTQRIFIIKYIRCLTRFGVGFEPQTCIFSAWMYHLQENPIILGYFGCNHQGFRLVLFRDFPTNSNPKIDRQDGNKKRTPGKQWLVPSGYVKIAIENDNF